MDEHPASTTYNGTSHEVCATCGCVVGHGCPDSEPCGCDELPTQDSEEGQAWHSLCAFEQAVLLGENTGCSATESLRGAGLLEGHAVVARTPKGERAAAYGRRLREEAP